MWSPELHVMWTLDSQWLSFSFVLVFVRNAILFLTKLGSEILVAVSSGHLVLAPFIPGPLRGRTGECWWEHPACSPSSSVVAPRLSRTGKLSWAVWPGHLRRRPCRPHWAPGCSPLTSSSRSSDSFLREKFWQKLFSRFPSVSPHPIAKQVLLFKKKKRLLENVCNIKLPTSSSSEWRWVLSHGCTAITTVHFWNFFICPNWNFFPSTL